MLLSLQPEMNLMQGTALPKHETHCQRAPNVPVAGSYRVAPLEMLQQRVRFCADSHERKMNG
jgi:hypothetical protein